MNMATRRVAATAGAFALALAWFSVPGGAVPPLPGPKCRSTASGVQASSATTITVATYNVLHGLTEAPPAYPAHSTLDARLAESARQLADDGVDIAGMQEVSLVIPNDPGVVPPTQHVTQDVAAALADALATKTGEKWHWCWFLANPHIHGEPDVQEGGGGPLSDLAAQLASAFVSPQYKSFKEGLAVVSRFPIVAAEGVHLPGRLPAEIPLCFAADDPSGCALTAGFESRAALWARVGSPIGPIDVTTTHLAHDITDASDASSLEQAASVLAFSEAMSAAGSPVYRFLTCDCNSQPEDDVPVVTTIESAGWTNSYVGDCTTNAAFCTAGPDVIVTDVPARVMNARLDYVFWKPGSCYGAPAGRLVVDAPLLRSDGTWLWPSDHLGVGADTTGCS